MIKHHHEQKMTDVTVIDDVLCNKCGESVFTGMTADDGKPYINGITLRCRWGYESKKDNVETVSHICENCHDEFAASFKIPQVVIDWLDPWPEGLPEDEAEREAVRAEARVVEEAVKLSESHEHDDR